MSSLNQKKVPDLSIIIVHRNGVELLRDCLVSLPKGTEGLSTQVIVVDNGSIDESVEMVREEFPEVELISVMMNLGFTRGNNRGLQIARGRYVCLLNNDTQSCANAFAPAIEWLDENPDAGIAGLKLLNQDGSRQLSCRRFPSFQQALFNRYSLLTKLFPENPYSKNYLMSDVDDTVREVDWVSGACLIVRREVINRIGGLDERFFMYSEDVDYCLRCWKTGWRVVYLPIGEVYHYVGKTSSRYPYMPMIERHKSMYLYYKKHYSRELIFLDLATGIMILIRLMIQLVLLYFKNRSKAKAISEEGANA